LFNFQMDVATIWSHRALVLWRPWQSVCRRSLARA
jgi:hypothetical protein